MISLAAEMLFHFILLFFAKEYLILDRMYIRHSLLGLSKGAHFLSECTTFKGVFLGFIF